MKKALLFSMTIVIMLLFSYTYAKHEAYNPLPKPVPLVLCSTDAPEIQALPDFFSTPTYQMSKLEPLHIRKDISEMSENDPMVVSLKKAIAKMKAKESTIPTSWVYQSSIHGTTSETNLPSWNSCAHGSEFFLSWHRMYVYFFERILRKESGNPNFALPYWDWSKTDGRSLPQTFIAPKSEQNNLLFVKKRDTKMNVGGLLALSNQINLAKAMQIEDLLASQVGKDDPNFNSTLERIHGNVHTTLSGLMADPNTAAQDPIFWMHHCNIDYIWEKWMDQHKPDLPDAKDPWMTKKFAFFDENDKRITMSGKDIVDIARQLNYKYEEIPIRSDIPKAPKPKIRKSVMATPSMMIAVAKSVALSADKNMFSLSPTQTETPNYMDSRFNLVFEQIKLKGWADGVFELYLNQSTDSSPDPNNDNYIGSIDFFALNAQNVNTNTKNEHFKEQIFDVTDVIRAYLAKNNQLGNMTVMIYHRLPELNGSSEPQKVSVQATVGIVKLVQH